jgi:hypothetical protein
MTGIPIRLEDFGCVVWLDGETIYTVELGDFEAHGMADEVTVEVTAPEGDFLDRVNCEFGTAFALEEFAGR